MEGKEQILHIFGSGEPFGEVPVFSGSLFPVNAHAIEKCSLIFFPLLLAKEQQKENIIHLNISKGQLASLLGTSL